MKKLLILLMLTSTTIYTYSFTAKNGYVVKGTTEIKAGKVILKKNFKSDTTEIRNGKFQFKGNIEKPELALLEIQALGGMPAQLILEPGEITVVQKDGNYKVGGSANNIRLQQIQDQLSPYTVKIRSLREKAYQERGEEQKKLLAEVEAINKEKVKKAGELLKADASYTGFVVMLSFYRSERAGSIANYLEKFKAFSQDPGYKRVADYYKEMPKADVGLVAPSFILQNLEGKMISLSDFKGKYVLIDFWYTDCPFCRKMAPNLVKVYADLKDRGFEIVSISIDVKTDGGRWREAIKKDSASWIELWDYDKTLPGQYGVDGYPTMYLLDQQGKVLQKLIGYQDEAALRDVLGKYIK